jgi:hypothetical protein
VRPSEFMKEYDVSNNPAITEKFGRSSQDIAVIFQHWFTMHQHLLTTSIPSVILLDVLMLFLYNEE